MLGKIYFVATPIGNMGDITKRAVDVIKSVDFVVCEDTRVTVKLLNFLDIKKEMLSLNKDSESAKTPNVIKRVKGGQTCAVVCDAGTPCIQDPGEGLLKKAIEENVDFTVIPGANAALCALVLSGLSTTRFSFEGFLSTNKKDRYNHLEEIKLQKQTLVFYESKHRLKSTLLDIYTILGNRDIAVVKEVTKIYENTTRSSVQEAISFFEKNEIKGEYVLVVNGFVEGSCVETKSLEYALKNARDLLKQGYSKKDASKIISIESGVKKGDIYKALIEK